jgi:methylated-DNA-[protein]-cysteine S-methyltransferase
MDKNAPIATSYVSSIYDSPVGQLTLAAGEDGLKGLWFKGQKHFGGKRNIPMEPGTSVFIDQAFTWLDEYFTGKNPPLDSLTLTPVGSEFQQIVWRLLYEIPFGQVRTYGDLAKEAAQRMGRNKMSAQAVGGAVGHNLISIIIPCHRVVGAQGNLTGYAPGIPKKLWLLEHENIDCSGFFIPAKSTAP